MTSMTAPSELAALADELQSGDLRTATGTALSKKQIDLIASTLRLAASPSAMKEALEATSQLLIDVMHDPSAAIKERASCQFDRNIAAIASLDAPAAAPAAKAGEIIPSVDNCGKYLAECNDGRLLYLNHANEWQECPNYIKAPADSDAVREACAKVADAHKGSAAKKRLAQNSRANPDALIEIYAEERGEDIASEMIASAIRAFDLSALTAPAVKATAVSEADVGRIKNTKNVGRFRVTEGDDSKLRVFEHVEKAGTPARDIELCECRDRRYAETIAIALEKMCRPALAQGGGTDAPAADREAVIWTKKRKGCANIYTTKGVDHAVVDNRGFGYSPGVTWNGQDFSSVDEAKAAALHASTSAAEGK